MEPPVSERIRLSANVFSVVSEPQAAKRLYPRLGGQAWQGLGAAPVSTAGQAREHACDGRLQLTAWGSLMAARSWGRRRPHWAGKLHMSSGRAENLAERKCFENNWRFYSASMVESRAASAEL